MNRRDFIQAAGAALAGGLSGGCAGLSELADLMRVRARIGIVASPQVDGVPRASAGRRNGSSRSIEQLKYAYAYFRWRKVDAVAVLGDLTRDGLAAQADLFEEIWRQAFVGLSVRRLLVPGPKDASLFAESDATGENEVNGFRFWLSYEKPFRNGGLPAFFAAGQMALTDGLCAYPIGRRRFHAGSLSGIQLPPGYEGGAKAKGAAQGLLVSAGSSQVVISRLDFTNRTPLDPMLARKLRFDKGLYAEEVDDPWRVDLTSAENDSVGARTAPEFWPDTVIAAIPGTVKGEGVYTVRWPLVQRRYTGVRAFSYELTAAPADDSEHPFMRRVILSDGFCCREERESGTLQSTVRFADLPDGRRIRFGVTPLGSLGERGQTKFVEVPGTSNGV